jgi:microcystin-dependent protein
MPAHDHPVTAESKLRASSSEADTAAPGAAALAEAAANIYIQDDPDEDMFPESVTTTVTIESTGGSQAHDNMQPWIAMNWIICLEGIYPDRS